MKRTLEQNITSEHVVARGYAILDEMSNIIEGVKNYNLIPEGKKSIKKFVLNQIKEDPELVFDNKYASNIVELTKKTGTYNALNSRYKEVLMDKFKIGRKMNEKEVVQNKTYDKVDLNELEELAQEVKEICGGKK